MKFELIKGILFDEARARGLVDFDVYYRMATDASADALNREPNASSFGTAGGVSFRAVVDGRIGSAATECFEEGELRALVARAMANAPLVDADEEPIFYAPKECDVYLTPTVTPLAMPGAATLRETAMALQEGIYAASSLVTNGTETAAGAAEVTVSLANSKGLSLSHKAAMQYAYAEAVVNDGGEASYGTASANTVDLSGENIATKAVEEALAKLGGAPLPTGKYNVVFSAKQVRALLSTYGSIFSGKRALQGLSLLAGKEGTEIAAPCLSIIDDPFFEESTMQMPFDAEGVPTYKKALVENGVLKTLLYDLTTAKKAGKVTTGNAGRGSYADPVSIGAFCLRIAQGDCTLDDLFARLGDGVFITELKGLHAGCDAVTGDFSIESAGFLVKNGKKAGAVRGFTVAGNFFELLKNIVAVGSEVEHGICGFSMTAAPAILVQGISVAGAE